MIDRDGDPICNELSDMCQLVCDNEILIEVGWILEELDGLAVTLEILFISSRGSVRFKQMIYRLRL